MISRLFNHRIRGFRTINLGLAASLLVIAVGVNLAKVVAGKERNQIGQVEADIRKEKGRIRVLEAEVAHLEQPERLERLSRQYLAMAPLGAKQETVAEALPEVAVKTPRPQPVSTPAVTVP